MTRLAKYTPLLVRRPKPQLDESLRGFLLRVEFENSIKLSTRNWGTLKSASATLSALEAAVAHPLDCLRSRVFPESSAEQHVVQVNVYGHRLPKSWICNDIKRICSSCLRQRGFMDATWEINLIKTCPIHMTYLVDHCVDCGNVLRWDKGDLITCQCGRDLRHIPSKIAGSTRARLDQLLTKSVTQSLTRSAALLDARLLAILRNGDPNQFVWLAIVSGHVAPHSGYAFDRRLADTPDEQVADFALSTIRSVGEGLFSALFSALGNEMQNMPSSQRLAYVQRGMLARNDSINRGFALPRDIQHLAFTRAVIYPLWDETHAKWMRSIRKTLAEEEVAKLAAAKTEESFLLCAWREHEQHLFDNLLRPHLKKSPSAVKHHQLVWGWFKQRISQRNR